MSTNSSFRELAAILDDPRLRIVVVPERVAPSAIYDLHYRLAVLACVFVHASGREGPGLREMSAPRMKLWQFVACRPWLLPVLKEWSENRGDAQRSLLSSQRLRRGFLGDTMYDDVTSFLVARGVLARYRSNVVEGPHVDALFSLDSVSASLGVFAVERQLIIHDLPAIKITNQMLEGW